MFQVKALIKYIILSSLIVFTAFKLLGDRITYEELVMLGLVVAILSGILDVIFPYLVEYEDDSEADQYMDDVEIYEKL